MSLLLDALKKSEAQRRRGTSPTIDLTRTPPSGNPRRSGSRWLPVLLVVALLAAAAPWLWPQVSNWMEKRQGGAEETGALTEAEGAAETAAVDESGAAVSALQSAPAPVAGASSPRRVAVADATPVGEAARNPVRPGDSDEPPAETADGPDSVASKTGDGGSDDAPTPAARPAEPSAQAGGPTENFIRPWELPEAQRSEFPELRLSVHFFADRAADRFVLINGERYREGQRVAPRTTLAEIRQRGAVVEFGSYRVLIE